MESAKAVTFVVIEGDMFQDGDVDRATRKYLEWKGRVLEENRQARANRTAKTGQDDEPRSPPRKRRRLNVGVSSDEPKNSIAAFFKKKTQDEGENVSDI